MGLVTLTPQQFAKTAAAKRGGTYQGYRSYIAKRRSGLAQAAAAPTDPYTSIIDAAPRPYTPQQIQQQLAAYTQGMPQPLTQQQIQQQAQSMISPLVAAITGQVNREAATGASRISGYTNDLAAKLAAVNYAAPYQQGEIAQANVDAALQSALAGQGSADAQDLSSRLASINDPSVGQAASAVAANGVANGNTQLAQGSNALSALIANAAAAGSYGQKQPGIAELSGLQQLGALQQLAAGDIASQTGQLDQQIPGIVQALSSRSDTNAANLASARQQLSQYLGGINENRSKNLLSLFTGDLARQDTIAAQEGKNIATVQAANARAAASGASAATRAAESDRSYRLQFAKTFGYDPVTGQTLPGYTRKGGQVVKVGSTAGGGKPLTSAGAISFLKGLASTKRVPALDSAGNTQLDSNNKVKYTTETSFRMPYKQAYQQLTTTGRMSDKAARKALDTIYPKGQGGRDWLSNEQQQTLKASGQPQAAGTIDIANVGSRAYITQAQAKALRAKRMLPAGFWYTADQGHTVYVIKPGY